MRLALALVLAVATVGSLALSAQPHRLQLARRVRLRLSRPGLGRPGPLLLVPPQVSRGRANVATEDALLRLKRPPRR